MGKAFRLQSAMEYLMTYGWAILIIAVVLGALFSLGIFNPAFLAPKVQPFVYITLEFTPEFSLPE